MFGFFLFFFFAVFSQGAFSKTEGGTEPPLAFIAETGSSAFSEASSAKGFFVASELSTDLDKALNEEALFSDFEEESGFSLEWKMASGMNISAEKGLGSRFSLDMGIYGNFKWKFVDFLSVHAEGLVLARRGFQQSFSEREDLKDGVNFLNFYYRAETPAVLFASPLIFQFGILNQNFLNAPFLLTDTSFTGLLSRADFSFWENSRLSLFMQSAVLYNAGHLFVRPDSLNKAWPFFLSFSGFFDGEAVLLGGKTKAGGKLTLFHIGNLTPEIAGKSRKYGNTVNSPAADARFEYGFAGFYNSLNVQRRFSENWNAKITWDLIHNFLAPKGRNTGDKIQADLYHNYRDFMELGFKAAYFENESDTSVSYFSSELYGRNNRRGVRFELQSHLYSSGLTLRASYTYMKAIETNTFMGRINSFHLILTSNYIPL